MSFWWRLGQQLRHFRTLCLRMIVSRCLLQVEINADKKQHRIQSRAHSHDAISLFQIVESTKVLRVYKERPERTVGVNHRDHDYCEPNTELVVFDGLGDGKDHVRSGRNDAVKACESEHTFLRAALTEVV